MIQYPVQFSAVSISESGTQSPWLVSCGPQQATCAVPPEFAGSGGGFSPEDLYLQALTNCFVATLKVYAEASRIQFKMIHVESKLVVDRNEQGQPWMKEADFKIKIEGVSNPDRLRILADKAIKCGFILNSVKTHLNWSVDIVAE